MEKRKVQKTGRGTLIISLPKEWVVKNRIKAGDSLEILEVSKNALLIKTDVKEPSTKKIKFTDLDKTFRDIVSGYIRGFKRMEIEFENNWKDMTLIRELCIRKIPGIEVENIGDKLVLEVIGNIDEEEMDKNIKKMINSISWFISSLLLSIEKKDVKYLKGLKDKDDEIDRINMLINRRVFVSLSNLDFRIKREKLVLYKALSDKIESIGDSLQTILISLEKIIERSKNTKKVKRFLEDLQKLLEMIKISFTSKEASFSHDLIDYTLGFQEKIRNNIKGPDPLEIMIISSVLRIFQIGKEIGEILLNYLV